MTRISLAELRSNAEKGYPPPIEDWCAEHTEVLALLDAVEAAHALLETYPRQWGHPTLTRLEEALTRFDFGDSS